MAESEGLASWLRNGLVELYEESRHCDVVLIAEGRRFPCHKLVLCAASKYFDAMYSSGMQEASSADVVLKDINARELNAILNFMYYGTDIVRADSVGELFHVSTMLELECVQDLCVSFMIKHIACENAVGLWRMGKSHNCQTLADMAKSYALDNFEEVWKSEDFQHLGYEDLLMLITDIKLNVWGDESIFLAVLHWLELDEERRRHEIRHIFPYLRFTQTNASFIRDHLDSNQAIMSDKICNEIIKDALRYHETPPTLISDAPSRKSMLVLIGKQRLCNGDEITEVVGYNFLDKKWYSLWSDPLELGNDFATCSYGNDIFVSGGSARPKTLLQFSYKKKIWRERSAMIEGRYRHAFVALGESLFCLGGYNLGVLKSIEEYDMLTDSWGKVGELQYGVDAISATVSGYKIFVFGGGLNFKEDAACIQCFDKSTRVCTVIGNLPSPCRFAKALTYQSKTYVVCPNGEVCFFKPNGDVEIVHIIEGFFRRNFGLYLDNIGIYVLGGERLQEDGDNSDSDQKLFNRIEIIFFNETKTNIPVTLPSFLKVYGCFRIQVPSICDVIEFSEMVSWKYNILKFTKDFQEWC